MSSFRISSPKTVVVSPTPPGLPPSQDTQILTNVNGSNIFSYPGYNYKGNDMFPENGIFDLSNDVPAVGNAWFGAVLHPNGLIYTTPYTRKSTLIINPYTNTWSERLIPDLSNTDFGDFYRGGVVAPNGKIYYAPFISQYILVNDVPNNRFYKIYAPSNFYSRYSGVVLAQNGLIYGVPCDENNVMVINPSNDSYTTFDISGVSGDLKWTGGVLANNGKIYCCPGHTTSVLIIDPATNSAVFNVAGLNGFPSTGGYDFRNFKWNGGALGANGKIYFPPYSYPTTGSQILEIDTSNNTSALIGPSFTGSTTARRFVGATLSQNGVIYSFPEINSTMLTLNTNTATPTWTTNISVGGGQRCWGSCLSQNNKVFAVPNPSQGTIIKGIKTGIPLLPAWMLAPQFNKF